jgi:hypothetical protein
MEVLWALKVMGDSGISSPIFVSSPTPMRRIRIITTQVVPDPTRYQIVFRGISYVPASNMGSLFPPVKAPHGIFTSHCNDLGSKINFFSGAGINFDGLTFFSEFFIFVEKLNVKRSCSKNESYIVF